MLMLLYSFEVYVLSHQNPTSQAIRDQNTLKEILLLNESVAQNIGYTRGGGGDYYNFVSVSKSSEKEFNSQISFP